MKEAKITAPKKGVETPLNAKVQIPGYGVMTRKQVQKSIQDSLRNKRGAVAPTPSRETSMNIWFSTSRLSANFHW